ncbi:MAG: hypothetical protein ACREAC_16500, partial [Blastocatellia bacterium]
KTLSPGCHARGAKRVSIGRTNCETATGDNRLCASEYHSHLPGHCSGRHYVEQNPKYIAEFVFDQIDNGHITAVTSPVTLAESHTRRPRARFSSTVSQIRFLRLGTPGHRLL